MDTKLFGGLTAAGSGIWALFEFGVMNVDVLYSVAVPLAFRIAPRVRWLDAAVLENVVLLLSVVFVTFSLARLAERGYTRLRK
jgi:hypothetical protein